MPERQSKGDTLRDLTLIEPLLWGLWAPNDADPKRRAEFTNDATAEHLTVNDVICARRAYERVLSYVQKQASDDSNFPKVMREGEAHGPFAIGISATATYFLSEVYPSWPWWKRKAWDIWPW